jgi:hypothetical protein
MHSYNDTMVISLGLNCTPEGHIEDVIKAYNLPAQQNSGFFDWTIVSFDSIIQFFEHCRAGTAVEALANPDNYVQQSSSGRIQYPKNTVFDCVYIWHIDNYRSENFREKSTHKLNTLLNHKGKKYFVIDNTSVQIIANMETVGEDPSKFILTLEQHDKIKDLAKEVFDAEVIFMSFRDLTKGFPTDHPIRCDGLYIEELRHMFGL